MLGRMDVFRGNYKTIHVEKTQMQAVGSLGCVHRQLRILILKEMYERYRQGVPFSNNNFDPESASITSLKTELTAMRGRPPR